MSKLRIHAFTDAGPVRRSNEDHILVGRMIKNHGWLSLSLAPDDDWLVRYGFLCAVADGVGGESGGATASAQTLAKLEAEFHLQGRSGAPEQIFVEAVNKAAARANETLLEMQAQRADLARMGCTMAGVCLLPGAYVVFSAGDSRVYRIRNGLARELTEDDTVTNAQLRTGRITEEQAAVSAERHTLLNLVGSKSFQLTCRPGPEFREGDSLFICSDGIHDLISYSQLEECFQKNADGESALHALCAAAVVAGGRDNLSGIIIELTAGTP